MSGECGQLSYLEILEAARKLGPGDQRLLLEEIKKLLFGGTSAGGEFIEELRERRFRKGFSCPHCSNEQVIRYGNQRGRQRYKCSGCGKTFCDHTPTPYRGTHYPKLWLPFMEHMVAGRSLRKTAELIGIAASTAFVWRHKLLTALKRLKKESFEGILEVDETYFLWSEKGSRSIFCRKPRKRGGSATKRGISDEQVCIVVARDRNKQTHAQVACLGQIGKAKAKTMLDRYVAEVTSLCSDANGTWKAFAREAALDHKELNLSQQRRVLKRLYHVQNVNAYHSRLKHWMDRFR